MELVGLHRPLGHITSCACELPLPTTSEQLGIEPSRGQVLPGTDPRGPQGVLCLCTLPEHTRLSAAVGLPKDIAPSRPLCSKD